MFISTDKEQVRDCILKLVPVEEVLSARSMRRLEEAIKSDFYEGVEGQWGSQYSVDYPLNTVVGGMKLERDALLYAIKAFEGSIQDFLDEFIDYLDGDDEARKEVDAFLDLVDNGEVSVRYVS